MYDDTNKLMLIKRVHGVSFYIIVLKFATRDSRKIDAN